VTRRSLPALAAALAVLAGCGGGDGTPTAEATQRCLRDAGYAAVQAPGSPVLHTTGQVEVRRGGFRAAIYFFDSEGVASRDAVALGRTLGTTGGGLAVQRGAVVIGYARRPGAGERKRVEDCLR
jgi:hypothetical protein